MSDKSDILILGATGFTGKLITGYLSTHPQRSQFSLALGARSPQKLKALVEKLNLSQSSVKLVQVDVTNEAEVERAVRSTRVVINTVGPYWLWGTPVVRSCARNGVHYVDLTGETTWTRKIIYEFDYFATKTGAIIVPSCGFDSVPSDAAVHLANKTLKSIGPSTNGEYLNMDTSTSAFSFRGGISGGTIASFMTAIESVPDSVRRETRQPYATSPIVGITPPPFRFLYNLSIPGMKPLIGAFFIMGPGNTALVQRSCGLLELYAKSANDIVTRKEALLGCYGSNFKYSEFQVMSSIASVIVYTAAMVFGVGMLLIRYLVKKILPQSGEGPSEERMQNGFFKVTNITTSTSSPPVQVKTVIKGKGDPGYRSTSVMIAESALCFLLPLVSESSNAIRDKKDNLHALPPLARKGGILTPMTAFGDVLLQRLEETGRFEFSSSIVGDEGKKNV
ncbi:saccharopine dehydrogenase [Phlegmacium glaucopus]|nr:saccharopine dehydrogenase [Phlegmacium glaucopus]